MNVCREILEIRQLIMALHGGFCVLLAYRSNFTKATAYVPFKIRVKIKWERVSKMHFPSIVNYCAMAVVQLRYKFDFEQDELTSEKALEWYDAVFKEAFELMEVRIMIT